MYVAVHVALVFVCPAVLLSAHKFKAQITGPWDEAVPRMDVLVRESSIELELAAASQPPVVARQRSSLRKR